MRTVLIVITGILLCALAARRILPRVHHWHGILPTVYHWNEMRSINRIFHCDPAILRAAGRELMARRAGLTGPMDVSDPSIPPVIRDLRPRAIFLTTNSVSVDVGNVYNPFGFIVFAEGTEGHGPRKWLDGLWFFDDGQLSEDEWPVSLRGRPTEP